MNVNCPHCNTSFEVSDNFNNEVIQCPVCNREVLTQGTVNTHKNAWDVQNSMPDNTNGEMAQKKIPNYLVCAILVTIFLSLLFGIPAIVYASRVKKKLAKGDIQGAQKASKNAKLWITIAFVVGILKFAIRIIVYKLILK